MSRFKSIKRFTYKTIDYTSQWFSSYAMILIDGYPAGFPVSVDEASRICEWLNSVQEADLNECRKLINPQYKNPDWDD